ncbi:ABC transporter substrate-binding protein [Caulobacter sp. KR2-114]|uniref:ABC transporter substrate-binding protein n=1 Tax=Caulobacter sp. KR2-114 TaxID=3400912 RepID=UPI003C0DD7DB
MNSRLSGLAAAALILASVGAPAAALAAADPAATTVESFDGSLIAAMKGGQALGAKGRARQLTPAVERAFDLPTMTSFAVGPAWSSFTPAQKTQVIAAFTRLSVASWAHNFDSYSGEQFVIDPNVQTRGTDKVVSAKLVHGGGAPVNLVYRMRQTGGSWKVIDVFYNNVSQLTTRRSDLASTVASGGAAGVTAKLNQMADNLLK